MTQILRNQMPIFNLKLIDIDYRNFSHHVTSIHVPIML